MDGENNASKPYEQMDDLGGFPTHTVDGSEIRLTTWDGAKTL